MQRSSKSASLQCGQTGCTRGLVSQCSAQCRGRRWAVHSSPIGGVRATPLFAPRTPGTLTAMDATCSSSTVATWRGAMAGLAVRQVSEPRARPWRTPALGARTSVYARHMYDQYRYNMIQVSLIRIPGLSDCPAGAKLQTHCRSANNPSTACAQPRDRREAPSCCANAPARRKDGHGAAAGTDGRAATRRP